jgi:hypothetical protein
MLASGPGTLAADSPASAVDWSKVATDLSSDSYRTREGGAAGVGGASWKDLPTLQALAKASKDPEQAERLRHQVDALEEAILVDPPPITVTAKDLPVSDILGMLSVTTGKQLVLWQENEVGRSYRYSLDAHEAAFWDVMLALNKQHDLPMFDHPMQPGAFIVWNLGLYGWKGAVKTERPSVIAIPERIEQLKSLVLQPGAAPDTRVTFQYFLAFDPRLTVIGENTSLYDITDERGQVIVKEEPRASEFFWTDEPKNIRRCTAEFVLPEGTGKRLSHLKGIASYCLQVTSEKQEIEDIDTWGDAVFEVGGMRVWIGRFRVGEGEVRFDVHSSTRVDPPTRTDDNGLHVRVFDGGGRELANVWSKTGARWNFLEGCPFDAKGPYRVTVEGPGKVLKRTVHFEFQDVPLP